MLNNFRNNFYEKKARKSYIKHCKEKMKPEQRGLPRDYREELDAYWGKFPIKVDYSWHELYYQKCNVRDVRCIPEDLFYVYMIPKLNQKEFSPANKDKAFYDLRFPMAKRPNTFVKNINGFIYVDGMQLSDIKTAVKLCMKREKFIIKPSIDSGSGKGFEFVENIGKSESEMEKILLSHGKNYVVQEMVSQHPEVSKLNESSVNTIRIMTLLGDDQVKPLSAHIRIGKTGSHYDHYGIIRGCNPDGTLGDKGFAYKMGDIVDPADWKDAMQPCKIPSFAKLRETACELHKQMPYFKVLSWDFAIDSEGDPVLIEVNVDFPGINHHQFCCGAVFEDKTDDILNMIFKK